MTSPKGKHYNAVRGLTVAAEIAAGVAFLGMAAAWGMYEFTPMKDLAFKCFAGSGAVGGLGAVSFITAQTLAAR